MINCLLSCFVPNIFAVKVEVKLQSRSKKSKIGSFGGPIRRGRDAANFGHAFSNLVHFPTVSPRMADEKLKKEERKK